MSRQGARAGSKRPPAMLHHVSFGVADVRRAAAFYDAVLAPLGYARVWEALDPGEAVPALGYAVPGEDDAFAIKQVAPGALRVPASGFHLAFAAPDRAAVDAFHAAALAHGGRCNGAPGPRPGYGPGYYAAFVHDPEGYAIEAVVRTSATGHAARVRGRAARA